MSDRPSQAAPGSMPASGVAPTSGVAPAGSSGQFSRPPGFAGSFGPGRQAPQLRAPATTSAPPPPAVAQAFGRPPGTSSPFGNRAPVRPSVAPPRQVPPAYRAAFSRPPGAEDLQRQSGATGYGIAIRESPWWKPDAPRDPWRDPHSTARLVAADQPESDEQRDDEGIVGADAKGRRRLRLGDVPVRIAVVLALGALLLGLVGGASGFFLSKVAASSPLAKVDPQYSNVKDNRGTTNVKEIAAKVSPSVVSIEVIAGNSGGTGSGVVIEPDGYILTNNHVISLAAKGGPGVSISVRFIDGSISPATIIGRDIKADLAVIKVAKPGLVPIDIGKSSTLQVGDEVTAFGSPLGLAGTVTTGIVSALNRPMHLSGSGSDSDAYVLAIQTDAAINPGNSGGALVDANGALIGINSAIASFASGNGEAGSIGLGFAIPADYAMAIADQLIKSPGSTIAHGNLQLSVQSVTDGTELGVQVVRVDQGGAAQKAGIKAKDVILKADSTQITGVADLMAVAYLHKPGDKITLKVVSGGTQSDVVVTLS
ncbi:MAG: trypsin-like peptidase domain-containing protein [Antricoccus sp.]